MEQGAKIFVAGHRGLVGSAILRQLEGAGFENLLTRSRAELDLTRQEAVENFFETERPGYVFLAAAKVGGIHANNAYPADFIGPSHERSERAGKLRQDHINGTQHYLAAAAVDGDDIPFFIGLAEDTQRLVLIINIERAGT
mgnify:CR=1 FL=1